MRKFLATIIALNRVTILFFGIVFSLAAFNVIASAQVTAVSGSAYGYSLSVGLFGGPPSTRGPIPTVTLPAGGSAVPITATAPTGSAIVGPAIFFSSGPITVSTQGTIGATGAATSSTSITNINTSGAEPFTASNLASTCTASQNTRSGSTTITGGTLITDNGNDINGDGDFTDPGEHPPVTVPLAVNPAPNTSIDGHIHVNGAQDNFRYIFNEQITNPDGSLTVNAAHERLFGPIAVGDLIIGQSRCGVTAVTTAATVAVGGRVTTPSGRGIRNVRLSLTDSLGNVRIATTTTFGYYHFDDVQVGETYILTAASKRYTFTHPLQVLNINEETYQVNFIAN